MSVNALGASPAVAEESTQATEVTDVQPEVKEGAEPAPAKTETQEDKLQKRFDKLTKEKYDAQRRADRLEWENEQLRQPAKTESVAPVKPTLEESGYDDAKFQKADAEYTQALVRAEAQRILKEEREQQQQQAKASEFDKRQAEFTKSKPDYVEKVIDGGARGEWPCTAEMAACIRESEIGPQLAYHLADNPELAQAIAKLPALAQAREIGRIEARLETSKAAPAKVSQAPPPPAKIEATEPAIEKRPEDMSDIEFAKWRRRQIAQRR